VDPERLVSDMAGVFTHNAERVMECFADSILREIERLKTAIVGSLNKDCVEIEYRPNRLTYKVVKASVRERIVHSSMLALHESGIDTDKLGLVVVWEYDWRYRVQDKEPKQVVIDGVTYTSSEKSWLEWTTWTPMPYSHAFQDGDKLVRNSGNIVYNRLEIGICDVDIVVVE